MVDVTTLTEEVPLLFDAEVRLQVATVRDLPPSTVQDSLPELLELLPDYLQNADKSDVLARAETILRTHAHERAELPNYQLENLVWEFHVLRAAIRKVVETHGWQVNGEYLESFVDHCIALSTRDFVDHAHARECALRTERQDSLAQLSAAVDTLSTERRLREWLIAALTHDIRNPLSAAMMTAYLIARKLPDDPRMQTLTTRLTTSLQRADDLLTKMLEVSRISAGGYQFERSHCALGSLLEETVGELTTIHGRRFVTEGFTGVEGEWDCNALRRVFENLGSNAIKYGDPQGVVTFGISSDSKEEVVAYVHNFGKPITMQSRGSLFQLFQRSAEHQIPGWGIGLSIVKGLVEGHGGEVWYESEEGTGTTFFVKLPKRSADH